MGILQPLRALLARRAATCEQQFCSKKPDVVVTTQCGCRIGLCADDYDLNMSYLKAMTTAGAGRVECSSCEEISVVTKPEDHFVDVKGK